MAIRAQTLYQYPLCVKCESKGRITAATEVDHVIPLHQGGTDDFDNLQALCHDCHAEKTATEQGKRRRQEIGLDGWPVEDKARTACRKCNGTKSNKPMGQMLLVG